MHPTSAFKGWGKICLWLNNMGTTVIPECSLCVWSMQSTSLTPDDEWVKFRALVVIGWRNACTELPCITRHSLLSPVWRVEGHCFSSHSLSSWKITFDPSLAGPLKYIWLYFCRLVLPTIPPGPSHWLSRKDRRQRDRTIIMNRKKQPEPYSAIHTSYGILKAQVSSEYGTPFFPHCSLLSPVRERVFFSICHLSWEML